MDNFDSKFYRDDLAAQLRELPKSERKTALDAAKDSPDYWLAKFKKEKELKPDPEAAPLPDLPFPLESPDEFDRDTRTLAREIYQRVKIGDRPYDPYQGEMQCGTICDMLAEYLQKKSIPVREITRGYDIKDPNGEYNTSFTHVYLLVDLGEIKVLIDPTYLQFVPAEQRENLPPVLIFRYRDENELREQLTHVPIQSGMVTPFYLGFNSSEARENSKESNFSILSDDRARIDD